MLLLDNRGVDRERFITPLASDQLFSYIDSFLLDEEERERLEHHKDFCDEPDEYLWEAEAATGTKSLQLVTVVRFDSKC